MALERLRPDHGTAIVVLTHDLKFDVPALEAALRTDAFYVGAIGSRRTQAARREALVSAGLDEASIERVHGPAGLDIGADTPVETAIAILSEALAVRAGRDGRRLQAAQHRIHVETKGC